MTNLKAMTAEELVDRFQHCCHSAGSYAGDPKAPDCSDLKAELLRRLQRGGSYQCPHCVSELPHDVCEPQPAALQRWIGRVGHEDYCKAQAKLLEFERRAEKAEAERDALKGGFDAEQTAERQAERIAMLFNGDLSGGTSIRSALANVLRAALSASPAQPMTTSGFSICNQCEHMQVCTEQGFCYRPTDGPAAVAETTWVSVEERLPEIGRDIGTAHDLVLVFRESGTISVGWYHVTAKRWYCGHTASDGNYKEQPVTHWQPLPSPPSAPAEDAPQAFLTDETDEW